ncbi:hypothetical protein [Zunongwangia sp.]|uniref:hypothetical protein n=1 Tax=Zunongwangia sp. TaxID=1965325 RepID=UPI003AA8710C
MKKKIEIELKKLAQQVLEGDLEKKVPMLKEEAKKLYEKLTILQFTYQNLEAEREKSNEKQALSVPEDKAAPSEPEPHRTQSQTSYKEGNYFVPDGTQYNEGNDITEPNTEKIKDIVAQMPPETEGLDRLMQMLDVSGDPEKHHANLDEEEISDISKEVKPQVETPEASQKEVEPQANTEDEQISAQQKSEDDFRQLAVDYDNLPSFEPVKHRANENKPKSVNDRLKRGISIGLNDRLAYIKHLFAGNTADYNRVLSQLNTFSDYEEAYKFIQLVVKPDYNNWEGKEQYEERFIRTVENKFQQ